MKARRRWQVMAAGLVAVVAVAASGLMNAQTADAQEVDERRGIDVAGVGSVSVTPDTATAVLGVELTRGSVEQALADAGTSMGDLIATLRAEGVASEDIQTAQLMIHEQFGPPTPERPEAQPPVTGYTVSNMVSVTIRDISDFGETLDAAVTAAGDAGRLQHVQFQVDDPAQYEGQAREEAIADARATAEDLASLTGVSLGDVLYVRETSGPTPLPIPAAETGGRGGGADVATPVSPGQVEVQVTVQVVYGIE